MTKYYIYRITAGDKYYIGNTTNFEERWANHQSHSQRNTDARYNYPVYVQMRAVGVDNCSIEIMREIYACTKLEARMEEEIERKLIHPDNCLNSIRAYKSKQDIKADKKSYRARDNLKQDPVKWALYLDKHAKAQAKYRAAKKAKNAQ